ncbi:MAG: hypothetical protein Q9165_001608 [Trypethelium subeluteriae]
MENFVVLPGSLGSPPTYLQRLEMALTEDDAKYSFVSVLDAVSAAFMFLREPCVPNEIRLVLHGKYCDVLSHLRNTLAYFPSCGLLPTSVFLLALYQMTMSISPEEKGWIMHLDGILALLKQDAQLRSLYINEDFGTVIENCIVAGNSNWDGLLEASSGGLTQSHLFLSLLIFQLRKLTPEMDDIFRTATPPRRLDVLRLHNIIKRIYKDLNLLPSILPAGTKQNIAVQVSPACQDQGFRPSPSNKYEIYTDIHVAYVWNIFRTMLIICGSFLLRSGRIIEPHKDPNDSKKTKDISQAVSDAVDGTCASVPFFLLDGNLSRLQDSQYMSEYSVRTLHGLLLLWPLYTALQVPNIPDTQREWIKGMLNDIGMRARIPKAFALAQSTAEDFSYSDVVAGSLLLDLGFFIMSGKS